jgi:hypothetical protein
MIRKLKVEGKTPSPFNRPNYPACDWMMLIHSLHKGAVVCSGLAIQPRRSQAMRAFTCKTRGTVRWPHNAEKKHFSTISTWRNHTPRAAC